MSRFPRHFSETYLRRWILLGLAALTIAVYAQTGWHEFVNLDDKPLITENPHVLSGLTWKGVVWAFTSTSGESFWQPLTWLSHMTDIEMFGLDPAGHHLVAVALHVVNAMLLFLLLQQATGAMWRSGLVAEAFGRNIRRRF